jgi:hypothetical protein
MSRARGHADNKELGPVEPLYGRGYFLLLQFKGGLNALR